jgi:hypothetical protein
LTWNLTPTLLLEERELGEWSKIILRGLLIYRVGLFIDE